MNSFSPTEFEFLLPKGWLDAEGQVHRAGRMRLATAKDEINGMRDARVQTDPGYGTLVMLSAVITQLGPFSAIASEQLETLFRPDFHYLKAFYEQIHQTAQAAVTAHCPNCQHHFSVSLTATEAFTESSPGAFSMGEH